MYRQEVAHTFEAALQSILASLPPSPVVRCRLTRASNVSRYIDADCDYIVEQTTVGLNMRRVSLDPRKQKRFYLLTLFARIERMAKLVNYGVRPRGLRSR